MQPLGLLYQSGEHHKERETFTFSSPDIFLLEKAVFILPALGKSTVKAVWEGFLEQEHGKGRRVKATHLNAILLLDQASLEDAFATTMK